MLIALFLAQAATSAFATPPDIEVNAHVRARSLTIEKKGEANLTLKADPPGEEVVDIEAPRANGRKVLRNINVNVRAEAHIADPRKTEVVLETGQPE